MLEANVRGSSAPLGPVFTCQYTGTVYCTSILADENASTVRGPVSAALYCAVLSSMG